MLKYGTVIFFIAMTTRITEEKQNQRLKQRVDSLELRFLTENVQTREEIYNLGQALERIEERLNESLTGSNGHVPSNYLKHPEETLLKLVTEKEEHVLEITEKFRLLNKGLRDEKVLNSRVRRHLSQIDGMMNELHDKTEEAASNIRTVLSKLDKQNDDIADLNDKLRRLSDANNIFGQLQEDVRNIENLLRSADEEPAKPKSCLELLKTGHRSSGVYEVYPGVFQERSVKVRTYLFQFSFY